MAQDNEEILLRVVLDEGQTQKRVVDLKTQLNFLKDAAKGLAADLKNGDISNKQYTESLNRIEQQSRLLNKELQEQQKALDVNNTAQKASTGSLTQLRAQLQLNVKSYDELSRAERTNADVGGKLEKRINELNKELVDAEKGTGRNQRVVGSYSEAIEKAISGQTTWTGKLSQTKESLSEVYGQTVNYVKGIGAATEGMGTAQKASFALGLGLKAIGIGLLITALTALIAFFKSTDAGADKLQQTVAALKAGFDAVAKTIAPLGEALVNTFLHPIDTVKKFGEALLHPLDTLKAIATGSREMADDIAANFATAASAAVAYTKSLQDIEDNENALIAQREKVGLQVDQALLKVKDRNLSEKERIRILQDAGKEEAKLARQEEKNATDRFNAEVKRNRAAAAQGRELTDDERKQQLEAEAGKIKAQRETLNVQQTITNRISLLREQETSDAKAAAEKQKEIAKKAAQDRVYLAQLALIQAKKNGQETLSIEEEIIRREGAVQKVGLTKNSAQRKLIDAKVNADILQARLDHLRKIEAATAQATEDTTNAQLLLSRKGSQKEFELQLQLLIDQNKREKELAVEAANDNVELRAGLTRRLRLIDAKYNADSEALSEQFEASGVQRSHDAEMRRLQGYQDVLAQSVAEDRRVAQQRIDLEEVTQLKLLAIAKKAALDQVSLLDTDERARIERDFQQEERNIQSTAIKDRRNLRTQEREDNRTDREADIDAQLHSAREGSKKEYKLLVEKLEVQRERTLDNEKLTSKQRYEINADFDRKERDLAKKRSKEIADQITTIAGQVATNLTTLLTAQQQNSQAQLEKQQTAALNSAGTNAQLRLEIEETYQKKKLEAEKQAAHDRARIARIEAIINTARGVTEAIPNPFLIAAALATGLIQQLIISNNESSFADGGVPGATGNYFATYTSDKKGNYIGAGPGTTRSDSIPAKISVGESVISAAATARHYSLLSAINADGGGRRFPGAQLTEIPKFASGVVGLQPDTGATLSALVDRINSIQTVLVLADANQVQKDQNRVQVSTEY